MLHMVYFTNMYKVYFGDMNSQTVEDLRSVSYVYKSQY